VRTALDVHRDLLAGAVQHEMVRLRGRITTADDLPEALELRDGCLAVRVYRVFREDQPPSLAAVLVPARAEPHEDALLRALDAEAVQRAGADDVNAATGYAADLVCPVGLPPEVEVLADAAVGGTDVVYTAAGEGGIALGIRTRDLLVATGAGAAALIPGPVAVPLPRYADIVDLDAEPRSSLAPAPRRDRPGRSSRA
jgi:hypothetical protein